LANLEAQAFSTRLASQLKANGYYASASSLARQFNFTPHAARLWLLGVNIPQEHTMQALAKWLDVDARWLRYGGLKKDPFASDYMSLPEKDKATVRSVVEVFWKKGLPKHKPK
jgi:transcriptional regulator with XRE-family HTH domain